MNNTLRSAIAALSRATPALAGEGEGPVATTDARPLIAIRVVNDTGSTLPGRPTGASLPHAPPAPAGK